MTSKRTFGVRDVRLSRRRLLATSAATVAFAATNRPWTALAQSSGQAPTPPAGPWKDAETIPATLPTSATSRFRTVAKALTEAMAANGVPGAALGILMDGVEEHAVFGVANLATLEPVTSNTLFQIGSVTKPHTATAVMRLVAKGELDLYAPVRTYLPEFDLRDESVAARVTVYHLLTHSAGWWGDTFITTSDGDDALARYVQNVLPVIPQTAPLGAVVSYDNTSFSVLGRLIEVVTGKPYRQAMQELLLDPLGMSASTFDMARVERGSYALGYASEPAGTVPQTPLLIPRSMDPSGLMWSTTRDQLRFARLHLADGAAPDGSRLLPAYTARLMRTAQKSTPGYDALQVGLSWWVQEIAGILFATHSGDTFGQHAVCLLAPDRAFALTLLTNALPGGGGVDAAVVAAAGAAYLGIDAPAEQAQLGMNGGFSYVADGTPLHLTAAELAEYAGRYETPDAAFTIRVANDQLTVTEGLLSYPGLVSQDVRSALPEDVAVPLVAGDRLAVGSRLIATFPRKPDGEIGWIGVGGRVYPKVKAG